MTAVQNPMPKSLAALRERAGELLRASRYVEAVDVLSAALKRDSADARLQLQLGVAFQALGRHADAIPPLTAAQRGLVEDAAPFLHAAVSLLALGRNQEGLVAASEACHRAPKLATAHYAYGQAYLALGQPDRAEQAFGAAVKLAPRWADAYVNFGLARYRQGAIEDAKAAMRLALEVNPGHAAAFTNLTAFMRVSGESEAAEKLMRERIAAEPQAIGARLNLAADLLQEERAAEALALLNEANEPADPSAYRHWRLQQTLALLQLRRPREARESLDALGKGGPLPAAQAPLMHWRRVLLAAMEGDAREAEREAGLVEESLDQMGPEGVPEHAIMARFDLAKFWSGNGRHSRAFAQWKAGHAALARFQPFSRAQHRAFVDASIAIFTRDRLADGPRAGNADRAPVFIVGMPRSGTTLTEQILAAHRDVHGAGERTALGGAFFRLGGPSDSAATGRIAALDAADFDRAAADYLAALHALAPDAARVVDKMPGNFLFLGLAGLMTPGAHFIHCVRDPRDIGLSIFTFRFHGQHGYAHDLADLGWYIGEHDRLMAHWRDALPNRIATVRLNDWVEDFEGTLGRLLAHLDLPPDENCARFYESESRVRTVSRAQVRQPVNARGLGRWRTYHDELAPLIHELEAAGSLEAWKG